MTDLSMTSAHPTTDLPPHVVAPALGSRTCSKTRIIDPAGCVSSSRTNESQAYATYGVKGFSDKYFSSQCITWARLIRRADSVRPILFLLPEELTRPANELAVKELNDELKNVQLIKVPSNTVKIPPQHALLMKESRELLRGQRIFCFGTLDVTLRSCLVHGDRHQALEQRRRAFQLRCGFHGDDWALEPSKWRCISLATPYFHLRGNAEAAGKYEIQSRDLLGRIRLPEALQTRLEAWLRERGASRLSGVLFLLSGGGTGAEYRQDGHGHLQLPGLWPSYRRSSLSLSLVSGRVAALLRPRKSSTNVLLR